MRRFLAFLISVLPAASLSAAGGTAPLVKMAAERLPDLNIPRNGCVMELGPGGEPVVFGGHTTGFVPTQTAEYFADGAEAIAILPLIAICAYMIICAKKK